MTIDLLRMLLLVLAGATMAADHSLTLWVLSTGKGREKGIIASRLGLNFTLWARTALFVYLGWVSLYNPDALIGLGAIIYWTAGVAWRNWLLARSLDGRESLDAWKKWHGWKQVWWKKLLIWAAWPAAVWSRCG